MESEFTEPRFVYLSFQEGEVLLNLNQIVFARDITNEEITLDLSNGRSVTVHGESEVVRIVCLLATYATIPEGVPLAEFLSAKGKMH